MTLVVARKKINLNHYTLWLIGTALVGVAIIYLRRPDAIANPQFWAEDGRFWYAQAYNDGPWRSLFLAYAGSLQLAMRLVASLTLLAPLKFAPHVFAWAAILIQLAPAVLINLKRFRSLIPSIKIRLLITGFYLLMPAGFEIHANLTNINWRLALVSFLIVVSIKYRSKLWILFDHAFLVVAGLTGPFSIILAPIAFIVYRARKDRPSLYISLNLASTAFIQSLVLVLGSESSRLAQPLQPSLKLFVNIIGHRVGLALSLGSNYAARHIDPFGAVTTIAGIGVIAITAYVFLRARLTLRLFIMFCWGLLFASLIKPQASEIMPQWQALLVGAGARYFFLPLLCLFVCLVYLAFSKQFNRYLRLFAGVIIGMSLLFAIPSDFRYPPRHNMSYRYFVDEFNRLPRGETYCLPINPDWNMCLRKH